MKYEEYYLNGYKLRSFLEYYFGLWLNELQEQNFINKWTYEDVTFPLFEGLKLPYKKRLKYKIKDKIPSKIITRIFKIQRICVN